MSQTEIITYKANWWKPILMIIAFSGMGWVSYASIQHGGAGAWWWMAGFSVLGIVLPILLLIPGSTYLRLAPEGLTFRHIYRSTFLPWEDIQEFDITSMGLFRKCVIYRLVEAKRQAGAARSFGGFDGGIPGFYNASPATLCSVLQSYLDESKKVAGAPVAETGTVENLQIDRSATQRMSKKLIFISISLILLTFSILNLPSFIQALKDKFNTVYREKAIEACVGKRTGDQQKRFCACCADGLLSGPFTKRQLWANEKEVGEYLNTNVVPRCEEEALHPPAEKMTEIERLIASRPKIEMPKSVLVQKAIEASESPAKEPIATKESEPAPKDVEPAKESESSEEPAGYSIYLKNRQVIHCSVIKKEGDGIWVEVEGGKAYFNNSEIKEIKNASS